MVKVDYAQIGMVEQKAVEMLLKVADANTIVALMAFLVFLHDRHLWVSLLADEEVFCWRFVPVVVLVLAFELLAVALVLVNAPVPVPVLVMVLVDNMAVDGY